MSAEAFISSFLQSLNEILTAANVIVAASLLLYNLTRNLHNRVTRSSASVLACVTIAYLADVFVSLDPLPGAHGLALRIQWIGIAFIPSALFHLADTLLATTGLPSRGRRRRIVRILYLLSFVFSFAAIFTDTVVSVSDRGGHVTLSAEFLFPVFLAFFLGVILATFLFVDRARRRGLTRTSQRRMAYLQFAVLTPAFGIFPFSVLLPETNTLSLGTLLLVNAANLVVILMLIFLSYPLSFFGSDKPDRVVKVELLRFLLRGPGTGLMALATIIFTTQATRILGLAGEDFMPFAVVGVVMLWQWSISLGLPTLEKLLIYNDDSNEQLSKLQDLSDRVLTRSDMIQLIEATLRSISDYFRVPSAFVLAYDGTRFDTISQIGKPVEETSFSDDKAHLLATIEAINGENGHFHKWTAFQIVPLYSLRAANEEIDEHYLIGLLGVQGTEESIHVPDEDQPLMKRYINRLQQTLEDMMLQTEVFAALEGLLPQISMTRTRANAIEYRVTNPAQVPQLNIPSRDEMYEQVRAALRHYWGGPGITRSRLLNLNVVQQEMDQAGTPTQALRNVILRAIERLRPEGERSMFGNEWIIYNILDLRFIEGKKVKEVTKRMSMSDADFYRKQRVAISAITDTLLLMEAEEATTAS
ncbi:MAG: hypothetical protein KC708_03980 [Anaerolineae bacterium]|nr:hypothetical protein [Anaerolineae bacterium]